MTILRAPLALLFAAVLLAGCAMLDEAALIERETARVEEARELFERFIILGNHYDTTIANLYAEEAEIVMIERKRGQLRKVEVIGADFKALVQRTLPRAERKGVHSSYSDVTFRVRGDRVRIDAIRTAMPHGLKVPHILVVGPSETGEEWLIYQEVSVTPL